MDLSTLSDLARPADTKVVLLVIDGLGGLPRDPAGETELEAAHTPNLDDLAARSITGLHEPIGGGITPGSGPAHLALFGYDALEYRIGRGVLAAAGIDFDLRPGDVACRGNFCTLDDQGRVSDRRAGRIPTATNQELAARLQQIELPGVEIFVRTIKEHRVLVVFRGDGLGHDVSDTDPQATGREPRAATGGDDPSARTAELANTFGDRAREVLADAHPANMVLLRGFASLPDWPTFPEVYGTTAASVAAYPMYRGLGRLLGMDPLDAAEDPHAKFAAVREHRDHFDFFFVHVKQADSTGEDGDFDGKVAVIEGVDRALPDLLDTAPDVLVVTGDHSTPWRLASHSWHPVPVLLAADHARPDPVTRFGERALLAGGLGPRLPATHLMPLAMAHAGRLEKFGA